MFAHLFEEGGMEVYAKHIHEFVLRPSANPGEGDIQRRSQAFQDSEAEEMVRNVFWRLQSLPTAQAEAQTLELVEQLKASSAAMSIEQLMN